MFEHACFASGVQWAKLLVVPSGHFIFSLKLVNESGINDALASHPLSLFINGPFDLHFLVLNSEAVHYS